MKIEIKETLDYRTEIDLVETFEAGKKYYVVDSVGKSIVSAGKAVEVEAPKSDEPKKDSEIKPEETKIVEVEEKKEAPKADNKKADKKK